MKNILLPTDFSSVAKNAYLYARDLATYIDAQLKVVNICYPDKDTIGGFIPSTDDLIKHQQKQLDSFVGTVQETSLEGVVETAMVETEVIIGFPKEEIQKLSSQEEVDLIIMGTTGSGSNRISKMIGSVSSGVAQKANCPVLLVPPEASFEGIKNMLYAGNYESAKGQVLNDISELAEKFEADIHLVHIAKEASLGTNPIQEVVLERLFKKVAPELKFEFHTMASEKVWEGLDKYARTNDIDLIVLVTRQRSFWESLSHKSLTRKMIFYSEVPLLVMHTDK